MTKRIRQIIFGLWAVWLAVEPMQLLAMLPASIRMPIGPLQAAPGWLVDALFTEPALWALRIVGALLAGACAVTAPTGADKESSKAAAWRWLALVACIAATLQQCMVRSFGHVNHAEIPMLLGAWALAIDAWLPSGQTPTTAPAPDSTDENPHATASDRAADPREDGGAFVVLLVFCFSYTLVAMHRFAVGGFGLWFSDRPVGWLIRSASVDAYFPFGWGRDLATWPWIGPIFGVSLLAITVLELLAPAALISRRFAWLFIAGMAAFHLTSLFLLNILFLENLLLLGLLGYWVARRSDSVPRDTLAKKT